MHIARLQASPELMKLLSHDDDDGRSQSPFATKPPSRGGTGAPSASKGRSGLDTPRGLDEEELTEDELLRQELEKVKNERNILLHSITVVKAQAGEQLASQAMLTQALFIALSHLHVEFPLLD